MPWVHKKPDNTFVQTIPAFSSGRGGYANAESQNEVMGGYAGATFELPKHPASSALKINIGDIMTWWQDGREIYSGLVIDKPDHADGWSVTLSGHMKEWLKRPVSWSTSNTYSYSVLEWFISNVFDSSFGLDSTFSLIDSTSYTPYLVSPAKAWNQTTIGAIIDDFNQYEGMEYGCMFAPRGVSLLAKPKIYYRQPNRTTLNMIIDGSSLADRPDLKFDKSKFGNTIIVWYGAAPSSRVVSGTAASIAKYGVCYYEFDIGGSATTTTDADYVGNTFLNSLKVDGIETPPISTEITLDKNSRYKVVSGLNSLSAIVPGRNIIVTGLQAHPRTLTNGGLLHIETVRHKQNGEVTLSVTNEFNPAALLARLKETV